MPDKFFKIDVAEEFDDLRIDRFLSANIEELSRTYIQKLITSEAVLRNDLPVKANTKVVAGDVVSLFLPEPVAPQINPENIPLDIVYEDDDVILVNKPKHMVVHPAAGHYCGTLVNALMYHCGDSLSGINGTMRPGIVHRIDMDTTGIIIACKNDLAHQKIAEQLKVHSITRIYEALTYGAFKDAGGRVDKPIGRCPNDRKKMAIEPKNGKNAITNYEVIENLGNKYAHIRCKLETGRTHQIRVHMSSIGHPLIGDTVYGRNEDPFHIEGQALHAGTLGFIHPRTGEYMEFSVPVPKYFDDLKERLSRM